MRKLLLLFLFIPFLSGAQVGIVTTVAGTGAAGYSGDGGNALAARFNNPFGVCSDKKGNIYITDHGNSSIRKIDGDGIITTIAGSGTAGFSGDGGPATNAQLNNPSGMTTDTFGNIYFCDFFNSRVRKVDTMGIISTFAGGGSTYLGDGGPATAARLGLPIGICCDSQGNTYICDAVGKVRKVDPFGIITTIAGMDSAGFSGDGGLATNAIFNNPRDVKIDSRLNIYIADQQNNVIRKIDRYGIISTFAGGGAFFMPFPCPATATTYSVIEGLAIDSLDNVYVSSGSQIIRIDTFGYARLLTAPSGSTTMTDGIPIGCTSITESEGLNITRTGDLLIGERGSTNCVRKVRFSPDISTSNLSVYFYRSCGSLGFTMTTSLPPSGLHVRTFFGDGTDSISNFSSSCSASTINLSHNYYTSGIYRIKHVLFSGSVSIDSMTYDRSFTICADLSGSIYFASSSTCLYDPATDLPLLQPLKIEVDSNGTPLDTISVTSGFYYHPLIDSGAVYSFRPVSLPPELNLICPGSGVIYDSLHNSVPIHFGMNCSSTFVGQDFSVLNTNICGRHMANGQISVGNAFCTATSGTVTLRFSPQYIFGNSTPTPSSVVGNVVTWDFSGISTMTTPLQINYRLNVPSAWLIPGDTINTDVIITPYTGDLDTTNNHCHHIDTVKSSFDPNMITVSPSGYILPRQKLEYAITFENTGNDTAHNNYVMDTLPAGVNPHSLTVLGATAMMNTTVLNDGTHNIVKFEFPHINLLDSSHHGHCTGTVYYSINTYPWLTDGTSIINHAGIFFDDNPVVLTDTATNVIEMIHGYSSVCIGYTDTLHEMAPGGHWSGGNSHASI